MFSLVPVTARASDQAAAANQLLAAQLLDAVTTRAILQRPGGYERDPLAKPFVKTNAEAFASVVLINFVARKFLKPTLLRIFAGVHLVGTVNNIKDLSR